jgi:hypothetical protein
MKQFGVTSVGPRRREAAGSGGRGHLVGPAWPEKKGTGTMAGPPNRTSLW